MRHLILLIIFTLISTFGYAQSLTISDMSSTKNHATNEFLVAGHQVTINNASLAYGKQGISSGLNVLTAVSAILNNDGVSLYSGNGKELYTASYNLEGDDSSLKVYVKANGGFIIRENIVNFLFYNTAGRVEQSVSNSSQSSEGEAISELATDPLFKTVVLYNPKIIINGNEGSGAQIVKSNGGSINLYYSTDRAIRFVNVSDDGQFIGVVSYKAGSDDELLVFDRFGNELASIPFDQNISDVRFSEQGDFVTIRSNGRVGVYSVVDENRIGSTSFRSTLHFAEYVPEDRIIIALTAEKSGSSLSDIELHAINIAARSITRQEYSSSLGISSLTSAQLERTGSMNYTITGLSKILNLSARF